MSCEKLDIETIGNNSSIAINVKDPEGTGRRKILEVLDAFEKLHPELRVVFYFFQYGFAAKMLGDIPCTIKGIWIHHLPNKKK